MNRTEIPAPFYAAAGAGDVAYQQLRKLPELANRTAGQLRQRIADPERDLNVELARLRESAQRSREALLARAVTVQDRTVAGYRRLVARGERVMAERRSMVDDRTEPAGIEVEVGPVQPAADRN
jgi:hypothetical protein